MYFLVPKSSTYTGLDCVKKSATNISRSRPFKSLWPFELEVFFENDLRRVMERGKCDHVLSQLGNYFPTAPTVLRMWIFRFL